MGTFNPLVCTRMLYANITYTYCICIESSCFIPRGRYWTNKKLSSQRKWHFRLKLAHKQNSSNVAFIYKATRNAGTHMVRHPLSWFSDSAHTLISLVFLFIFVGDVFGMQVLHFPFFLSFFFFFCFLSDFLLLHAPSADMRRKRGKARS